MNVGSLFAGIGGFDLGFERAGMRTLWQVEQDPYRRAVLARHFPDAERYEDVREVGARNLEWVDLICGGFPCQPVSVAGHQRGQDDHRWIWPEYARIVGELRPRYVVVENVPGLLTRGMGDVLGDLAALGYDAEWDCLPAASFGAPHLRDRVWLLAYPNENRRHTKGKGETGNQGQARTSVGAPSELGSSRPSRPNRSARSCSRNPLGEDSNGGPVQSRRVGRGAPQTSGSGWWAVEPDVGRVAHGISHRLDRLAALGDSLVPQIAEWIGRRLMEAA